ncbi:DUF1127 domain-containing protein [Xanthobacter sp. KR7-225]|uniref:DUF1127 domain-containing protein n=1 Tax=Xanthobacter sp. KR7-225 TaxID=3156613 RepID=UPI0032B36D10
MSVHGETRSSAVAPVGELVAAIVLAVARAFGAGVTAVGGIGRAMERRHALNELAGLDDHMLSDIGLTRADLRDATAGPLLSDPTRILALRASERRTAARLSRAAR